MKPTTIQSYLFSKQHWNKTKAKDWLKQHRKVVGFIDEDGYLHARQIDSDLFNRRSLRTIDIDLARGIKAVVGHLHSSHWVKGTR